MVSEHTALQIVLVAEHTALEILLVSDPFGFQLLQIVKPIGILICKDLLHIYIYLNYILYSLGVDIYMYERNICRTKGLWVLKFV